MPMLGLTALPHVGGLYGGFVTRKEVKTWYPTLNKPSWRPPNAAFPIVWTALYTGMGCACFYASYVIIIFCIKTNGVQYPVFYQTWRHAKLMFYLFVP